MSSRRRVLTLAALFALLASCRPPVARTPLDVTGAGSALERVTTEPVDETKPAISPDGRVLLFSVVTGSGMPGSFAKRTLVAVDPSTRAQRTLFTSDNNQSVDPAWLPDGSSYLYVTDSPGTSSLVRALTAAPNAAVNIVAPGEVAPAPGWPTVSPDSKRVAFTTQARATTQLAVIGIDGSRLTLLGEGRSPSWSPDGKNLAFCRSVGGHLHLFRLDPDTGTNLVQLTSGDYDHYDPSWSPDGKFLVFSTNRASPSEAAQRLVGGLNLFLVNWDGTGLTQLTAGGTRSMDPNWGADGWIYFSSDQEAGFDIWRLKPTGKYANLSMTPVGSPAGAVAPGAPAAAAAGVSAAPASAPAAAPTGGCTKDTDCKGDRVCEKGDCVSPPPVAAPVAGPAAGAPPVAKP